MGDIHEQVARFRQELTGLEIGVNARVREVEQANVECRRILGRYVKCRRLARGFMRGARERQGEAMSAARRLEEKIENVGFFADQDDMGVRGLKRQLWEIASTLAQWAENKDTYA
jgi:hypothetical protein